MDLNKIVWTATVSGSSNPERTKSEMPGTDDRQIMICSFSWCSLEQDIFMIVQSRFVLLLKNFTCLSQPREARPRWAWWRGRRPAAPRACSHSGSRRPTPRSPRWTWPTWGTNVSHKWPTWVVVRTIADKTSKSSPCDEEGSPCQSLPLGNSGSCQVLQPLGIATTHLVWNIFYTISRNCKKHLSVVFKDDFSKLSKPIFLKYLARDFQYFNGMAIWLIDSWTWLHFWSLLGFFWTKAKYAMRLNAWVSEWRPTGKRPGWICDLFTDI